MDPRHLRPIRSSAFEGAAQSDVDILQSAIGATLPDDFREFFRAYGWCGFSGDATVTLADGTVVPVSLFYGGGDGRGSLRRNLESHDDFDIECLVPFARDDFGNEFVLDGKRGFAVYWIDYGENPRRMRALANSFTGFLEKVVVSPYADDQPDAL